MKDPFTTDHIRYCDTLKDLEAALEKIKARGIELTAAQHRMVQNKRDAFYRAGDWD